MVTQIHCHHLHGDGYPFFKLASLGDGEAFFKDSSLEMDTWFSSHHLWRLYSDGAAFFKLASLGDGNVVLEQSYLWHLFRDGEAFFKHSSLEMDTWFSSHHLWRLLERWWSYFQRFISEDCNVVYNFLMGYLWIHVYNLLIWYVTGFFSHHLGLWHSFYRNGNGDGKLYLKWL